MKLDAVWLRTVSAKKRNIKQGMFLMLLYFISFLYRFGLFVKQSLYSLGILKKNNFSKRIISVGNITVGGTGKTPFVEEIGRKIIRSGKKLLIVEKGYKRKKKRNTDVVSDGSSVLLRSAEAGDEPFMIARNLPEARVVVSKDKIKGIKFGISEFAPDVVILDDGFQKRQAINGAHNVVLINAMNPFGYNRIFPAGLLREPVKSLESADTVVITNTNLVDDYSKVAKITRTVEKINKNAKIFESEHQPKYFYNISTGEKEQLDFISGKKIIIFSSLGNPEGFERTVSAMGASVMMSIRFRDHHKLVKKEILGLMGLLARTNTALLLTTEKDEVRLSKRLIEDKRVYALKISMFVKNAKELEKRLKI
jgi:tetraacyldisaccharide 4'-kinase